MHPPRPGLGNLSAARSVCTPYKNAKMENIVLLVLLINTDIPRKKGAEQANKQTKETKIQDSYSERGCYVEVGLTQRSVTCHVQPVSIVVAWTGTTSAK